MINSSRSGPMRAVVAASAAVICLSAAGPADAGVEVEATSAASYSMPDGFDLGQAQIQSTRDGRSVLSAPTGDQDNMACTVVVADASSATSFSYRYRGEPTVCFGVLPHPSGGFFLRGGQAQAEEGDVYGFTAFVDPDGVEQWVIDDQELVDARPEADNGTGEFLGQYLGPHPQMAYSEEFDKLLAFTNGNLNIGGGQQITQGHVVSVDTGQLRVSGWTFQASGSPGIIAEATARQSDGYFLVYIYSAGTRGAHFFTFNGRNANDLFRPLDEDWTTRYIRQMVYGPDEHVYLLWTPENSLDSPTTVTVVDDQGAQRWQESFDAVADVDSADEPVELGAPEAIWVGAEHALILYQSGGELLLRVIETVDGRELGVVGLAELTTRQPLAILDRDDGGFKLLAVDTDSGELHELSLNIGETDGGPGGGDAADDDAGMSGSSGDGGGCNAAGPAPVSGALLAFLLAVFTIATTNSRLESPQEKRNG
jgi:hypothetical protein